MTTQYGQSHPKTTVKEAGGPHGSSGDHSRSAITGQYVTTKHGKASPNTTVKNS